MKSLMRSFSHEERRNLVIYIAGIMFYKLALESLSGSYGHLILNTEGLSKSAQVTLWTVTLSCSYALQCFGSLFVSPLIRRYPIQKVLSISILTLGLLVGLIPVLEGIHGGEFSSTSATKLHYLIFVITFILAGIFHGVIELIRRVVPQDIVGSDPTKLKRMDSAVHIFYEIAGIAGAVISFFTLKSVNPTYALIIIPACFLVSSFIWSRIRLNNNLIQVAPSKFSGIVTEIISLFRAFFHSVKLGFRLVFTRRDLIWLIPAYSLPLVLHKYLENFLFLKYSRDTLGKKELSQILLAGSNAGELLGALFILLFANLVETPLPWLRLDALTLLIVWIFPYAQPFMDTTAWAALLAVVMSCISFGWASGDVSLVAFVQSHLGTMDDEHNMASPLGAVMAFLYVIYIILFAVLSLSMGSLYGSFMVATPDSKWSESTAMQSRNALVWTAGVFFSICAVLIFTATFIPKGSWAFNPKLLGNRRTDSTLDELNKDKENSKSHAEKTADLTDNAPSTSH